MMHPLGPGTPPVGSRKLHLGVFYGLLLLLAGNLLLPLFYQSHPLVRTLDYLGAYTLAFGTAGLAWRRARQDGPGSFYLLGLGAALSGLHYLPSHLSMPQAQWTGPIISILGILALGAGFLLWPQRARMPRDRARTLLDGIAITLSILAAAWMALGSLDWVGHLPRTRALMDALQIGVTLGVLALWLLQETRLRLPEQDRTKRYVRAALFTLLTHSLIGPFLRITGPNQGYSAHAAEVLHQFAFFLLGLAAITPPSVLKADPAKPSAAPIRTLFPSGLALAVLLLSAFRLLQPHGEPQRALMGLGMALLAVLMLRHGLLILDLERLSQNLEVRVEERTRKLEAQHHQAMSDLRMRIMAGLAAGLAHDLNNILGIIRLRLELLEDTCSPSQQEHLKVLGEASERAVSMTRRILASSRMQETHPSAFDFTNWMEGREGLLQALLRPDQRLNLQIADDLHVFADPQGLDQIFQNLVTNARDAMGSGGTLLIRAEPSPSGIRMEIRDDGPGIAADHLPRIFEPFFTTKAKGTGLGLATVRNLVLQNQGSIEIESEPGRGTAFLIDLPVPERLLLA